MNDIKVLCRDSEYNVYIKRDINSIDSAFEENNIKREDKLFIITDSKVYNLYSSIIQYLSSRYCCKVHFFPQGEKNKNHKTVEDIYEFLIDNEASRNSVLIALGGGVVGDIAGYVAATFMRGMKFVNIPTTLISQVDSSIGGKVGYNYKNIKNVIGSFYNPMFVYVNISFLETLEKEDYISGLGEVVKYGLIEKNNILSFIEENYEEILQRNPERLMYIIHQCLSCKAEVVSQDFRDVGLRNILNFGHTVGHGIEISSNYMISHGEAVALGMLAAIKVSESKLNLSKEIYARIESIYDKLDLITKYKIDNYDIFLYAINRDKKNDNCIRFVLLEELGKCKIKVAVTDKEIINSIQSSISRED